MAKIFAVALSFFPLSLALQEKAVSQTSKINLAYAAMNARVAPLWVAQERGFFTKNRIDTDPVFIRQAPILVAALTAGDLHIGYSGGTAALGAAVGGVEYVY